MPVFLLWTIAALGIISFGLALSSYLLGFQGAWVNNRFITERFRQWKFQQLLDGSFVALSRTDLPRFEKELQARWARAKFDLLENEGTINDFLEAENFELFVRPSLCPDNDLAPQIADAYRYLRLDYQGKYFSFKKETLRTS